MAILVDDSWETQTHTINRDRTKFAMISNCGKYQDGTNKYNQNLKKGYDAGQVKRFQFSDILGKNRTEIS